MQHQHAQFTSNKTVSVNTISAQVEAKGGIQISTDGTKWKSIISTTDITNAYQTYSASANQMPTILEPVSTIGVPDTNGKLPMYYGTVVTSNSAQNNGEYILTAEQVEDKDDSKRKNRPVNRFIQYYIQKNRKRWDCLQRDQSQI